MTSFPVRDVIIRFKSRGACEQGIILKRFRGHMGVKIAANGERVRERNKLSTSLIKKTELGFGMTIFFPLGAFPFRPASRM